jgi:hypothetical protein
VSATGRRYALRAGLAATLVMGTASGSVPVDRAVVRFVAPETGGVVAPRFIYERELAFEARLEALADPAFDRDDAGFRERHVRDALERHVAETLLESLPIDPEPTPEELTRRVEGARLALIQRVGGLAALSQAAAAEGIAPLEVLRLLRRQARASLYLDRMVAPMLDPSDAELRLVHRTARTPFSAAPFDQVREDMRRWYISRELSLALESFYEGARTRLRLQILD